jgi:hypothetical protein
LQGRGASISDESMDPTLRGHFGHGCGTGGSPSIFSQRLKKCRIGTFISKGRRDVFDLSCTFSTVSSTHLPTWQLPSPVIAQEIRMMRLLPSSPAPSAEIEILEKGLGECNPDYPTSVAFVSKVSDVFRIIDFFRTDCHWVCLHYLQMFANDSGGAAALAAAAGGMGFIGFTRVFMGTLRVGDTIQVLIARHRNAFFVHDMLCY